MNKEEKLVRLKYLIENSDMTLQKIGEEVGYCQPTMSKIFCKEYPKEFRDKRKFKMKSLAKSGEKNPWFGVTGEKHSKYKGILDDGKGYKIVLKPEWYTGRPGSNHIFYHHRVLCEGMDITEIPENHVVHHCDGNPHNNDFSNLVLMTSSEHARLHQICKERSTTISKESTLKWVEAVRTGNSYDIV